MCDWLMLRNHATETEFSGKTRFLLVLCTFFLNERVIYYQNWYKNVPLIYFASYPSYFFNFIDAKCERSVFRRCARLRYDFWLGDFWQA